MEEPRLLQHRDERGVVALTLNRPQALNALSERCATWRVARPCTRAITGDLISAEEARAKGLVNHVTAPEALDDEVEALVARIVAKPRVAVALGKALFYRQLEQGMVSAYEDAGATMACNMMDPSALEGVQAFIEKRPPSWLAAQGHDVVFAGGANPAGDGAHGGACLPDARHETR